MPDSHSLKRPPVVINGSSSSSSGMRPQEPLAWPSFSHCGSSSSSLDGLEQTIQPFQEFIKQTRVIDPGKSLPPIPPMTRDHLYSSPSTQDPRPHVVDASEGVDSRSSSVYSRTPSQRMPDEQSLDNFDADYESYQLKSENYASDVPNFDIRKATFDSLEARRFSPLCASPSPTLSAVSTLPISRPTTLMLDLPMVRERPKVRLMSLDKANRAFNAPGAIRLLPEELRAQIIKKLNARTNARTDSKDIFLSPKPPPLPPAAFIQTTVRSWSTSPDASVSPYSKPRRGSTQQPSAIGYETSINSFHVGTGPIRTMAPPPLSVPLRRSEDNDQRGRSRQRGRASREVAAPQRFFVHDLIPRTVHKQRSSKHREPSEVTNYDSEEDVRGHMKMIPQPLFQAKSPTQRRKHGDMGASSSCGHSHYRMQRTSQESAKSGKSSADGSPLRLSLTPPSGDMRNRQSKGSTMGMISISPPSEDVSERHHILRTIDTNHRVPSKGKLKQETVISSLYPQIMNRMKKKTTSGDAKLGPKRRSIGAPLLPADVVAAVLVTPATTPQTSPLASETILAARLKKIPSNPSSDGKRPLYRRFKGMTKHVRKGSKQQDTSPEEIPIARRESPHLFASAVQASQTAYSEWSGTAKATWDQARSNAFPPRDRDSQATSQDESEGVTEDLDNNHSRRPTFFGPLMDSYHETKAQKRRDNLKRTIKVIALRDEPSEVGDSGTGSDGESVIRKKLSGYSWM